MGLPQNPLLPYSLLLISFSLLPFAQSDPEYASLIYKGCSKQPFSDPTGTFSQSLSTVLGTLVSQSTKYRFYNATSGSGAASVSGLFQCRGDLTNAECYDCTNRLPILVNKFCGRTASARVQLQGCYLLYEAAGVPQISGMALLYKTCGGRSAAVEGRLDAAAAAVEGGVVGGGGGGFYETSYDSVAAVGQCEGDLGTTDCGACIKNAFQRAESECGSSASSAQIFLHKCFVSYKYYPNGVPKDSKPFSPSSSSSGGQNTGKTVAIILGGAAAVAFLVICLLFARSLMKKQDDF